VRALLQRVSRASVTVDAAIVGEIGPGLLILLCAMQGDTEADADKLAAKIAKLRIFKDGDGKMNLSLKDVGGSALIVSQFTPPIYAAIAPAFQAPQHPILEKSSMSISPGRSKPKASRSRGGYSVQTWMWL
jgi:D-tyrosyl-tRNA(Tyr) deacylase